MFCNACQRTWPYANSKTCLVCGQGCNLDSEDLLGPTPAQIVRETRPPQLSLAKAIEKALRTGNHITAEAGTGTGKSLAALIPAVLSKKRVVVSTATIALQSQYFEKDLPFLQAQLADHGVDFTYALAKGRSNYLCETLYDSLAKPDKHGKTALDVPKWFAAWARDSHTGDRAEHPFNCPPEVWLKVSAEDCPGKGYCARSKSCRFVRVRDELARAQIVVANHAITGLDIRFGWKLLPSYDVLLMDEAHKTQDAYGNAFTETLTERRIARLISDMEESEVLDRTTEEYWKTDSLEAAEASQYLDALSAQNQQLFAQFTPQERSRVLVAQEALEGVSGMLSSIKVVTHYLASMAKFAQGRSAPGDEVQRIRWFYGAAQTNMDNVEPRAFRFIGRLKKVAATLEYLELDDPNERSLRYVEFPSKATKSKALSKRPIDIGPILSSLLFPHRQVVAFSATITVSNSFDRIHRDLGFDPTKTDTHIESSPFDYARRAMLYLTRTVPIHPSKEKELKVEYKDALITYFDEMAKEMYCLCDSSGGHAFALFTNENEMNEVVTRFRAIMRAGEFHVIVQGETSPVQAEREFRSSKRPVLFALKTFWEGVSVEGDQLRLVMIAKVPFPSREDLLYQALRDQYIEKCGSGYAAFMKMDVPKMVMEVLQAAGRLLRTMDDYGVVAILDRKITEEYSKRKSYASILVNNLPFTQVCFTPGTVNKFLRQFKIMDRAEEKKRVEGEKEREEPCFAESVGRNSPPC